MRSLLPAIDEINLIIKSHKPSIVTLCETWLDPSIPNEIINIPGYTIHRKDRNRHGGGLLTYVSDDLQCTIASTDDSLEPSLVDLEVQLLEVSGPHLQAPLLLCNFYNHHLPIPTKKCSLSSISFNLDSQNGMIF